MSSKSVVMLTDRLDMTIAVDWDVKPQHNNQQLCQIRGSGWSVNSEAVVGLSIQRQWLVCQFRGSGWSVNSEAVVGLSIQRQWLVITEILLIHFSVAIPLLTFLKWPTFLYPCHLKQNRVKTLGRFTRYVKIIRSIVAEWLAHLPLVLEVTGGRRKKIIVRITIIICRDDIKKYAILIGM